MFASLYLPLRFLPSPSSFISSLPLSCFLLRFCVFLFLHIFSFAFLVFLCALTSFLFSLSSSSFLPFLFSALSLPFSSFLASFSPSSSPSFLILAHSLTLSHFKSHFLNGNCRFVLLAFPSRPNLLTFVCIHTLSPATYPIHSRPAPLQLSFASVPLG